MRLTRTWIVVALMVCGALVPPAAFGPAERTPADKTLSPYFFVDGDPAVDHLPR